MKTKQMTLTVAIGLCMAILSAVSLSSCSCAAERTRNIASKVTAAEWMKDLPDTLMLCRLSVPGTHDSGATRGGAALQTQDTGISDQLEQGIRSFDIRLQEKDGRLGVFHSAAFQSIYWEDDVLPAFISFLQSHPSETLIVSLKQEGGKAQDYASLLAASLSDPANLPYFVAGFRADLTLGECRGKVLFLHRDKAMDDYPGAACEGWADDATCLLTLRGNDGTQARALLQDEYQYKSHHEAPEKLEACLNNMREVAALPEGSLQWGISFASATGLPTGTPQAFADRINASLADCLEETGWNSCGIVFIDFVAQEGGSKLVTYLIDSNFRN